MNILCFIILLAVGLIGLVPFLIWYIKTGRAEKRAAKEQSDFWERCSNGPLDEIWEISAQNDYFTPTAPPIHH